MHNLRNTHRWWLDCKGDEIIKGVCFDEEATGNFSTIVAYGSLIEPSLLRLARWTNTFSPKEFSSPTYIAAWDAPCPSPDVDSDQIIDIFQAHASNSICIVLAGGDIVSVQPADGNDSSKIEIVGSVDAGITGAAWSPDQELLALVTGGDTLLFMTQSFDSAAGTDLLLGDLQSSKHVSVGWGKSETQFKGRGAKVLRDPTMPEKVDEGLRSSNDDAKTTISWRGDAQLLAVNSVQASSRRVIRIFTREGVLDGVSEPVDNLESALSWRPAGNVIAGVQRFKDRIDVVFFERNGLRHGQFPLRLNKNDMDTWASSITLKWNVDSTVLAVCFLDRVQLWTMGNYHYYLKQELFVSSGGLLPVSLTWNDAQPLEAIAYSSTQAQRLHFHPETSASSSNPPNDTGLVTVIDGQTLKLTAFRFVNVPPPMAAEEIAIQENIIHVGIWTDPAQAGPVKLALLGRSACSIWTGNFQPGAQHSFSMLVQIRLSSQDEYQPQQVIFVDDTHVAILQGLPVGQKVDIFALINGSAPTVSGESHQLPVLVRGLYSVASIGPLSLILHGYDGSFWSMEQLKAQSGETVKLAREPGAFPPHVSDIKVLEQNNAHGRPLRFFGLKGYLYDSIEERPLVGGNVTSFFITTDHLIFTTSKHLLKLVHLGSNSDLNIPPDTPETDERCRSIERGARIVTVVPSCSAVILQMPRGNLETVYPRALVLASIRKHISNRDYRKAFLSCRKHRVDTNILHDHDPKLFLDSVSLIVDQLRKVEHIDLLLSHLREEDVSMTMYKDTLQPPDHTLEVVQMNGAPKNLAPSPQGSKSSVAKSANDSKVNRICDAFLGVLRSKTATNLRNIITAHVCKQPPDLEAGLLEVENFQEMSEEEGESAVEHISFLVDVNRLYDTALGLYKLNLALLVAQQSQKDPREYLPFLQKLQQQSDLRRRFSIDDYLGRWAKGLVYLDALTNSGEETKAGPKFSDYVQKHNLYTEALELYRYRENDPTFRQIMLSYAEYLVRESRHTDAAIAFEYIGHREEAADEYRRAHMWREALACAGSDSRVSSDFAKAIADSLIEVRAYSDAAIVFLDHFHDVDSAVSLYCKGHHYADAIRLSILHQKQELLKNIVEPALNDGMSTMTELLAECKAQLNAQVPRLRELRIKKAEEPLAFFDADTNDGADIPDNISLAPTDASTTGGTLFTRYTNRTGTIASNATHKTSKNRRREERKRARGKKGSVYEEEYLVDSIGRLIDRVNSIGDEVSRLLMGLIRRSMREKARAVEALMVEVVGMCEGCIEGVFQNSSQEKLEQLPEDKEPRPLGGQGVLYDSLEEARSKRTTPKVKKFDRMSILGG